MERKWSEFQQRTWSSAPRICSVIDSTRWYSRFGIRTCGEKRIKTNKILWIYILNNKVSNFVHTIPFHIPRIIRLRFVERVGMRWRGAFWPLGLIRVWNLAVLSVLVDSCPQHPERTWTVGIPLHSCSTRTRLHLSKFKDAYTDAT